MMEKSLVKMNANLPSLSASPALVAVTLLVLFVACFRPGVRVAAGGQALPGVYSVFDYYECLRAAEAAAWEITAQPADLSIACELSFGFGIGGLSRDTRALERLILEQAEGVEALWVARLGDEVVGWVTDPSVMGELAEVILAEGSGIDTVSATFSEDFTVTRSYAPGDTETDPMTVSARLRDLAGAATIKAY